MELLAFGAIEVEIVDAAAVVAGLVVRFLCSESGWLCSLLVHLGLWPCQGIWRLADSDVLPLSPEARPLHRLLLHLHLLLLRELIDPLSRIATLSFHLFHQSLLVLQQRLNLQHFLRGRAAHRLAAVAGALAGHPHQVSTAGMLPAQNNGLVSLLHQLLILHRLIIGYWHGRHLGHVLLRLHLTRLHSELHLE